MKKELRFEKMIMIFSIVITIICVGIIVAFFFLHKGKHDATKKEYPINNLVNRNEKLTKEHCLDDFCLRNISLAYYKDSPSSVSGDLINKSNDVKDICFKISFKTVGIEDTSDFDICYYETKPNEILPVETYFEEDQKNLVYAEDYSLSYLTEEERKVFDKKREEERTIKE